MILEKKFDFTNKISREEIETIPYKFFEGNIVVATNEHDTNIICNYLKTQKILGFDTETRPNFKKGERNKVAILQLSTSNDAFIFQLHKTLLPASLIKVLTNENIVKAGVAIHDDIKALQRIKQFKPGGFVELQSFVKKFGIEDASLKKLSAIILGFRISKSQQLTNWETDKLDEAQKTYAATDAWVGHQIFSHLNELIKKN